MTKRILLLITYILVSSVSAQSGCKTDYTGKVYCAPAGGSAVDTVQGIACAPGRCVLDNLGYVKCSSELGGGVSKDNLGQVYCVGECVNPRKDYCVEMKKGS